MTTQVPSLDRFPKLRQLALAALETNHVSTSRGSYFRAGPHQFASLWTRDFCMAVPGILASGSAKLSLGVRDHLSRLLDSLHPENDLVPRMFDSSPSALRVLAHTAARGTPLHKWIPELHEPLRPEYFGEHGTRAMDSNILVLRAAAAYARVSQDSAWLAHYEPSFKRCFGFYDTQKHSNGLLQQGRYEDWQDSAKRRGHTSYLHMLYYAFCEQDAECLGISVSKEDLSEWREKILRSFSHSTAGLLSSLAERPEIALDAYLIAFTTRLWDEKTKQARWNALVEHPVWKRFALPGCPSFPPYPAHEISLPTHFVGLRHYHDGNLWTWLIAESAKVAAQNGDPTRAYSILTRLEELAVRDGAIVEIYTPALKPFRSILYRSEAPFTWGAGKVLEALANC